MDASVSKKYFERNFEKDLRTSPENGFSPLMLEIQSGVGQGGSSLALQYIESRLSHMETRPWVWISVPDSTFVYPPALSRALREALSARRITLVHTTQSQAPALVRDLCESGLLGGVWISGLEQFPVLSPATVWCRRWQMAARRGGTDLVWSHERSVMSVGFAARVQWTESGLFEIKRGHAFFETFFSKNKQSIHRRQDVRLTGAHSTAA
jgi:hypothetical protein